MLADSYNARARSCASRLSSMIRGMIVRNPTKEWPGLVRYGGFDAYLTRLLFFRWAMNKYQSTRI